MAWDMTAMSVTSSERLPLESVDEAAKTAVEEGFAFFAANPTGQRLLIPFDSESARDDAAQHIKSYCEGRPAGRLTASVYHGFMGSKGEGDAVQPVFNAQAGKVAKVPALSVKFTVYVKRERGVNDTPAPESETPAAE